MLTISNNIFYKQKTENTIKNTTFDIDEPLLDLIVIDNFYKDPMAVRNFALSQNFDISGNFPGTRTISFANIEIHNAIQEVLSPFGEVCDIHLHTNDICIHSHTHNCTCFNGAFFMNTSQSILTWIHFDDYEYTAIIYLTPDPPVSSGTSTFKLNDNYYNPIEHEYDKTKWSQIDKIGNVFNRILIFNASMYHCPDNYFGLHNDDSRLTQVVWFNLKPKNKSNYVKNKMPYCDKIPKSLFILNTNYKCNILIVDNFYKNPEEVRLFALSQNFEVTGNFPGFRTKSFLTHKVNYIIKKLLLSFSKCFNQNEYIESDYNGCFQYNTCRNKSWIHTDHYNDHAGIVYLTPDAPLSSGTKFYRFFQENADRYITDMYSQDMSKWVEVDSIGNKFNRLVLFDSKQFHISNNYFGSNVDNGRLIQLFFI
jgi:hypothetical protein